MTGTAHPQESAGTRVEKCLSIVEQNYITEVKSGIHWQVLGSLLFELQKQF
jgi:hypothetical protein